MKYKSHCRLCLQEKELVNKSHIIPDFMYQDLYDEKHGLYAIEVDAWFRKILFKTRLFTGDYEGKILCLDCENKVLGFYESYASKALYGGAFKIKAECPTFKSFINPDGVRFTQVENIDYKKFKLFLLSIIWRASISSRKFFKEVKLGTFEETLRQMILNGDAGKVDDFPVVMVTYATEKGLPKDLISNPQQRIGDNGVSFYVLLISGYLYLFYLPFDTQIPQYIVECALNPENKMKILHLPYQRAKELLGNITGLH